MFLSPSSSPWNSCLHLALQCIIPNSVPYTRHRICNTTEDLWFLGPTTICHSTVIITRSSITHTTSCHHRIPKDLWPWTWTIIPCTCTINHRSCWPLPWIQDMPWPYLHPNNTNHWPATPVHPRKQVLLTPSPPHRRTVVPVAANRLWAVITVGAIPILPLQMTRDRFTMAIPRIIMGDLSRRRRQRFITRTE